MPAPPSPPWLSDVSGRATEKSTCCCPGSQMHSCQVVTNMMPSSLGRLCSNFRRRPRPSPPDCLLPTDCCGCLEPRLPVDSPEVDSYSVVFAQLLLSTIAFPLTERGAGEKLYTLCFKLTLVPFDIKMSSRHCLLSTLTSNTFRSIFPSHDFQFNL